MISNNHVVGVSAAVSMPWTLPVASPATVEHPVHPIAARAAAAPRKRRAAAGTIVASVRAYSRY
ncbi:hypothetical protein FHR72_002874 [Mycolicibacterium iranicum]|uniref:Uncharacterized protein n=1 Tax=Mycolicibacterium iranicum TaxID=912594 RepID=A0A839Q5P8_MYCIR|nr:hypothetical protein [Mycolicibacterium iranicum]MBB2991390.1 hypothetical protein [Mycolicibacterium iranicum]